MEKKNKIIKRNICIPSGLRLREAGEGEEQSRVITGYAIMFNTPSEPLWSDETSEAREVIDPAAISEELLRGQDIKMTMFHDRQLILARSNKGEGTLSYSVDEKGVKFEFEAPNTADGDKAVELVKRGDISGCSFAYSTYYYDSDFVERQSKVADNGVNNITYRVKAITKIYDFTLAADPYYPDTSVETRELADGLRGIEEAPKREEEKKREQEKEKKIKSQIEAMREQAKRGIIL